MASQFAAVRQRAPRYDYTAAINAQTPYLPAKYKARKDRELADKRFALEKEKTAAYGEHLKAEEAILKQQQAMAHKAIRAEKKDANRAQLLNLGKIGMDAYFANKAAGIPGVESAKKLTTPSASMNLRGVTGLADAKPTMFSRTLDWVKPNQSITSLVGKGAGSKWMDALNLGNVATGATAGSVASNLLFEEDDDWWKKAGVGALAGGATNWLTSGGDLFSSAVGGFSGGLSGLFSFF